MKVYGLIGYPLGHSFSKKYFDEKFIKEPLADCVFENFSIPSINELPALIKNTAGLNGLCVTIPYKEQVLQFADFVSEDVKLIGACNCLKFIEGKITAFNTDVFGFEKSFSTLLQPHHTNALILGTGGAAKAIQFVLKKLGISFLSVSRNKTTVAGTIQYGDIDEAIMKSNTVIINCSPVGTFPNESESPAIPYQFVTDQHYLFDLVYNPVQTLFLKEAESRGARYQNGYSMLLIQAEENWRIWNEK